MDLAEKRQHVVLTQAEHLDVFHDHHFVVSDGEEGILQHGLGVFAVAASKKLKRLMHTGRSALEPLALGIFVETDEHFSHEVFESRAGEGRVRGLEFRRHTVMSNLVIE